MDNKMEKRKSSILRLPNEEEAPKSRNKVRFSSNFVKEFASSVEHGTVWDATYEESIESLPTGSQSTSSESKENEFMMAKASADDFQLNPTVKKNTAVNQHCAPMFMTKGRKEEEEIDPPAHSFFSSTKLDDLNVTKLWSPNFSPLVTANRKKSDLPIKNTHVLNTTSSECDIDETANIACAKFEVYKDDFTSQTTRTRKNDREHDKTIQDREDNCTNFFTACAHEEEIEETQPVPHAILELHRDQLNARTQLFNVHSNGEEIEETQPVPHAILELNRDQLNARTQMFNVFSNGEEIEQTQPVPNAIFELQRSERSPRGTQVFNVSSNCIEETAPIPHSIFEVQRIDEKVIAEIVPQILSDKVNNFDSSGVSNKTLQSAMFEQNSELDDDRKLLLNTSENTIEAADILLSLSTPKLTPIARRQEFKLPIDLTMFEHEDKLAITASRKSLAFDIEFDELRNTSIKNPQTELCDVEMELTNAIGIIQIEKGAGQETIEEVVTEKECETDIQPKGRRIHDDNTLDDVSMLQLKEHFNSLEISTDFEQRLPLQTDSNSAMNSKLDFTCASEIERHVFEDKSADVVEASIQRNVHSSSPNEMSFAIGYHSLWKNECDAPIIKVHVGQVEEISQQDINMSEETLHSRREENSVANLHDRKEENINIQIAISPVHSNLSMAIESNCKTPTSNVMHGTANPSENEFNRISLEQGNTPEYPQNKDGQDHAAGNELSTPRTQFLNVPRIVVTTPNIQMLVEEKRRMKNASPTKCSESSGVFKVPQIPTEKQKTTVCSKISRKSPRRMQIAIAIHSRKETEKREDISPRSTSPPIRPMNVPFTELDFERMEANMQSLDNNPCISVNTPKKNDNTTQCTKKRSLADRSPTFSTNNEEHESETACLNNSLIGSMASGTKIENNSMESLGDISMLNFASDSPEEEIITSDMLQTHSLINVRKNLYPFRANSPQLKRYRESGNNSPSRITPLPNEIRNFRNQPEIVSTRKWTSIITSRSETCSESEELNEKMRELHLIKERVKELRQEFSKERAHVEKCFTKKSNELAQDVNADELKEMPNVKDDILKKTRTQSAFKLLSLSANRLEIYMVFSSIEVHVNFDENSGHVECITHSTRDDVKETGTQQYIYKFMLHTLKMSTLKSSLGKKYNIASLLDFLIMQSDELCNTLKAIHKSRVEFNTTFDKDLCLHYKYIKRVASVDFTIDLKHLKMSDAKLAMKSLRAPVYSLFMSKIDDLFAKTAKNSQLIFEFLNAVHNYIKSL